MLKKIKFKSFCELIKDQECLYDGIPLNFTSEPFIKVKNTIETERDDLIILVTALSTNMKMPFRESTSEITYDKEKDLYYLKSNNREHIFKIK